MSPFEHNLRELQRLRTAVEAGDPIDSQKEIELAAYDEAIAEAVYTQDAIDRVNSSDDWMAGKLGDGDAK